MPGLRGEERRWGFVHARVGEEEDAEGSVALLHVKEGRCKTKKQIAFLCLSLAFSPASARSHTLIVMYIEREGGREGVARHFFFLLLLSFFPFLSRRWPG